MARVLVARQSWGIVWDEFGNARSGVLAEIDTTVYAAATGATEVTAENYFTNSIGELPGWVEPGNYIQDDDALDAGSTARHVEAVSGRSIVRGESALLPDEAPTVTFDTPDTYVKDYDGPEASLRWRWRSYAEGTIRQFATYFDPDGAMNTSLSIVVSNKRRDDGSIQDVSAIPLPDHEPSMVSISPDIGGPSLAVEAHGDRNPANNEQNQSALAVYNLDEIHSGSGSQTPGYGTKRGDIDGLMRLWWGLNLSDDPPANFDVRLEPVGLGTPHRGLKIVANDDCSVIELWPDGSVAASRNWRMAANYDGAGQLDFVRSSSSTGAPTAQVIATMLPAGDVQLPVAGKGVIVKSPDGTVTKRLGIDNAGALSITTP